MEIEKNNLQFEVKVSKERLINIQKESNEKEIEAKEKIMEMEK